jgi:Predicted thioesterase involved in non-ribosomal peptide biosynthesis
VRKSRPGAAVRLFCFPFAGGGASIFRRWHENLPGEIEVCAVQYPGRENRISEHPIDNLHVIVTTLFNLLLPRMDIPYAFFGHSLGAKIAFEIAKKLSRERGYPPVCLFVSGSRAPHIKAKLQLHRLEESEFINSLRRYAGTPEAVLRDRELMDVFLPMLRADFILDEKFDSDPGEKVDFPIYAFAGDSDEIAPLNEVEEWRRFTKGHFALKVFKGDHFFFRNVQPLLFESMIRILHVTDRPKSTFI